jgi:transposase
MGQKGKVVFKQYDQNKIELLPASYEEIIPQNHLVRLVNRAIEELGKEEMIKEYSGGGASSYHPMMLVKVITYAYTQKIYSSRQIAKALRENIYFRWLSGNNEPDFRTINRFRKSRLKKKIDKIFGSMVKLLHEAGVIKLENYFLDGTKIEANANKYSYVWKKGVARNRKNLEKKIQEILEEADRIDEEEDKIYGDKDLEEMGEGIKIDSKLIEETVKKLNKRLKKIDEAYKKSPEYKKEQEKELEKKRKKLEKDYLERMKRYEDQEKLFGGRNSYSKTDTEATFMRMKEDHLGNGQLKASYNIQIGTENQYIISYSIHQKPGDTSLLIPHIEELKKKTGIKPKRIITDAGYGSHENYAYLEKECIDGYVKYNMFDKEQKKRYEGDPFRAENMEYDKERDEYICPGKRRLKYHHTEKYVTDNGYHTDRKIYESDSCRSCRLKKQCYTGSSKKRMQVNPDLARYREQAKQLLESDEGIRLRKQRSVDVEPVFGQMKNNRGFRRFTMRGLENVHLEFGLHSLAHNLMKMHKQTVGKPKIGALN